MHLCLKNYCFHRRDSRGNALIFGYSYICGISSRLHIDHRFLLPAWVDKKYFVLPYEKKKYFVLLLIGAHGIFGGLDFDIQIGTSIFLVALFEQLFQ